MVLGIPDEVRYGGEAEGRYASAPSNAPQDPPQSGGIATTGPTGRFRAGKFQSFAFHRVSVSALVTTVTELIAIAAPANAGVRWPVAASGTPTTL